MNFSNIKRISKHEWRNAFRTKTVYLSAIMLGITLLTALFISWQNAKTLNQERQKYQEIDGVVRVADRPPGGFWQAQLRGDKVSFVLVDNTDREAEANMYFEGAVRDGVMSGEFRRGVGAQQTRHTWRAERVKP